MVGECIGMPEAGSGLTIGVAVGGIWTPVTLASAVLSSSRERFLAWLEVRGMS